MSARRQASATTCRLVEVFGKPRRRAAAVGQRHPPFRDPAFQQTRPTDARSPPRPQYAVDWRPDGVDFLIDDEVVRRSAQSPDYPMLLIIGLFDFPDDGGAEAGPELVVRRVTGT